MDKQDAIDFIIEEFEKGASPSEIARSLSSRLNAPSKVVEGFVSRTLEGRMALVAAPEAPAPRAAPADGWEMPTGEGRQAAAAWEAPADAAGVHKGQPLPSNIAPALTPTAAPAYNNAERPAASAIDPKLEKFILSALSGDKKQSDIVMAVCERTGLDWSEAQRLVGRVGAQNRKKITSRRNRVLIPFSIVAIIAGVALTAASLNELALYSSTLQAFNAAGVEGAFESLPQSGGIGDLRYLLTYGALGLGLVAGGGIGLFQSLQAQME